MTTLHCDQYQQINLLCIVTCLLLQCDQPLFFTLIGLKRFKACLSSPEDCLTEKMQRKYLYTASDFEMISPLSKYKPNTTRKPIQHLEKSPNYFYQSGREYIMPDVSFKNFLSVKQRH